MCMQNCVQKSFSYNIGLHFLSTVMGNAAVGQLFALSETKSDTQTRMGSDSKNLLEAAELVVREISTT